MRTFAFPLVCGAAGFGIGAEIELQVSISAEEIDQDWSKQLRCGRIHESLRIAASRVFEKIAGILRRLFEFGKRKAQFGLRMFELCFLYISWK